MARPGSSLISLTTYIRSG